MVEHLQQMKCAECLRDRKTKTYSMFKTTMGRIGKEGDDEELCIEGHSYGFLSCYYYRSQSDQAYAFSPFVNRG